MNLQDLIYFHYLAESLSFTATAKHFYVSQPSISMAIKRLEKEFDAVLIDRRKNLKQLELTSAGKILYKNVKKIIETLAETKQEIKDIELESVYFGFLPTIGGHFLPEILPQMSRYANSLNFVEEESSDLMLDLILQKKVPIAIVGHEEPKIEIVNIQQYFLVEEEIALWVGKNHPLAKKEEVTLADIQDEVFISLAEGYTHQRIFSKWAKEHQIKEPNIVYANEIRTVKSVVSSTKMIGFMSSILVEAEDTSIVKISIADAPKFYVSLVVNTKSEHSYIQQEFNDKMIEVIQNI